MCGLFFVCARVREARKRGWGNFEFFGIFGKFGGGWSGLGLSGSEKFLDFWEILGKNEIF